MFEDFMTKEDQKKIWVREAALKLTEAFIKSDRDYENLEHLAETSIDLAYFL